MTPTGSKHRLRLGRNGVAPIVGLAMVASALVASPPTDAPPARPGRVRAAFQHGAVLLGLDSARPASAARTIAAHVGAVEERTLAAGTYLLRVQAGRVATTIAALRRQPGVRYAEPDYLLATDAEPDDPAFGLQWGLENIGQTVNGVAGKVGADVRAPAAWNVTTGSESVVIAQLDTGVDYTHPDLVDNVWTNPGDIGGCPAGTHGYNVLAHSCDPMDDGGHGTHVAGIMAAAGNNGLGVTGVNWKAKILPVKFANATGLAATSDLISAMEWVLGAKAAGVDVRVINDSVTYVRDVFSQALLDEINKLGENGILFITAAGNTKQDNDTIPRYPCNYGTTNEICVAATDQKDNLAGFSNWGLSTVDLAAPGKSIYSTLPNGGYGYMSGTSMAAPLVAGTAALILATGDRTAADLKAEILDNVDPLSSLSGRVRTGGRLNMCGALQDCTNPLVGNPGFEASTSGWARSSSANTLTRVSGGHSGSWAAEATNIATSAATCGLTDQPNWVQTTSSGTYSASLWVKAPTAGAKLTLRLRELQGTTQVGQQTATVTLGTDWQQASVTYVPVAAGSSTLDYLATIASAPPGTCFEADDAAITKS
jgi:subtilisin family serine protease